MIWNLFRFEGDFNFGKNQKSQGAKSGLWGGGVTWVFWCFTKKLHETWCMSRHFSWWSCQSPVAHSCSLLNHPNRDHRGIFKLNTKYDADSLLYSVILNAMATQYTCSLNGISHSHWLVEWNSQCSHLRIPVHSPGLPGYINVTQTILIILSMARLFQDRPHITYQLHQL